MDERSNKLRAAKFSKDDEFYTRFEDIKKEVENYHDQLKNKIIILNCEDKDKDFETYFLKNKNLIGYKKLIVTIGDFREKNNINLLKLSDVVITNPPFSLFNEFYLFLKNLKKTFLIIAPLTSVVYKNVYLDLKNENIKIGFNYVSKFWSPNEEIENVGIFKKSACLWLTNLKKDFPTFYNSGIIYKKENYKSYKFYKKAINVDKIEEIPDDYFEEIGVPISFLKKWNPKQFKLIAIYKTPIINKESKFSRLIIQKILKGGD